MNQTHPGGWPLIRSLSTVSHVSGRAQPPQYGKLTATTLLVRMFAMSSEPLHSKTTGSLTKILVALSLISICICGYVARCLHLLNKDHYYIVSPDSYFFHWQAERVLLHQDIPLELHSGLTYPLAYAARALSFILGTSSTEALRLVTTFLPPFIGVISILVLYFAISRMYSKRAALLTAFVWAVALMPVFLQCAGYADRDGLSILLVMIAVFTLYLSRDWHVRFRNLEVGWMLGVAAFLGVEFLLYVEWMFLGPLILLLILSAFWAVEVMSTLWESLYRLAMTTEEDIFAVARKWLTVIPSAVRRSDWRSLALIICLNFAAVAVSPGLGLGYVYRSMTQLTRASLVGTNAVGELSPLTFADLIAYGAFTIPALLGLYIALKNRRRADLLFLGWFACLFGIGLFVKRFYFFAAPSICVLSGIGLAQLLDLGEERLSWAYITRALGFDESALLRVGAAAIGIGVICLGSYSSVVADRGLASGGFVSANNDWESGMEWLKENTPQEAVVMCHWTYGYFILDMADRRPVVDNGLYSWDEQRNHDVGLAYCTTDVSEAISIMDKYEAGYLIFSTLDYALLPGITKDALGHSYGDGKSIPAELRNSVYAHSLSGALISEGGLRRVYPEDPNIARASLVILARD